MLSILIPSRNEAEVDKFVRELEGRVPVMEIVICNDRDSRGKGWALREAFLESRGDMVAFIDGDGEIPARMLLRLLPFIEDFDVVVGSKRITKSPLRLKIMTRLTRWWFKLLCGVKVDTQTGIKLFRRSALEALNGGWQSNGFIFDAEIVARLQRQGFRIVEVPIECEIRRQVAVKTILRIFGESLWLRWRLWFPEKPKAKVVVAPTERFCDVCGFSVGVGVRMFRCETCVRKICGVCFVEPVKKPKLVSIIIPCKTMDEYAERCIEACNKLPQDKEIIVVTDEDCPGLPAAKRNYAMQKAKGDIYAFIDSDAYPAKDWLEKALYWLQCYPAVCGPGILPPDASWRERISDEVHKAVFCPYRVVRRRPRIVRWHPTFNLVVRKEVATKFDSYLTGEDDLFCERIAEGVFYHPSIVVYHNRRGIFKPLWKQFGTYARHKGLFNGLAFVAWVTTLWVYAVNFVKGFLRRKP